MATIRTVCGAFLLISVAGCTSVQKVLPQDGPTMLDIYEGHLAASGTLHRQTPAGGAGPAIEMERGVKTLPVQTDLAAYTRSVETEIETLFPELPNPRLVMYVFPHLATRDRLPVPGYATAFSMYERAEFALPGEVAPVAQTPRDEHPITPAVTRVVYERAEGGQDR